VTAASFEVRRENLRRYILDKYEGNRAAFSRAAGVHQNQINLLVTDNEEHRRNLGEALARKMEQALEMPAGFFDTVHAPGEEATIEVSAWDVPEGLLHIVGRDDVLTKLTLKQRFLNQLVGKITSPANLRTCRLATRDLEPEVAFGEHVIVDIGAQAVTSDGAYILGHGNDMFLRRVTKLITGGWLVRTPGAATEPTKIENFKGIKTAARLVMVWRQVIL
jgi:hypothetical protein